MIAVALLLAGCSSGQTASSDPHFSRTRIGLDSVDGQVGPLRLLSVSIASPGARGSVHIAGDSAALFLTVANDGTGQYSTIQAAIDAVPANNTTRRTITIKAGTYREIVTIASTKQYTATRKFWYCPAAGEAAGVTDRTAAVKKAKANREGRVMALCILLFHQRKVL